MKPILIKYWTRLKFCFFVGCFQFSASRSHEHFHRKGQTKGSSTIVFKSSITLLNGRNEYDSYLTRIGRSASCGSQYYIQTHKKRQLRKTWRSFNYLIGAIYEPCTNCHFLLKWKTEQHVTILLTHSKTKGIFPDSAGSKGYLQVAMLLIKLEVLIQTLLLRLNRVWYGNCESRRGVPLHFVKMQLIACHSKRTDDRLKLTGNRQSQPSVRLSCYKKGYMNNERYRQPNSWVEYEQCLSPKRHLCLLIFFSWCDFCFQSVEHK